MKRKFASFLATGVLALGALAGSAATASATNTKSVQGAFSNSSDCESWVTGQHKTGTYDCEKVAGKYPGWYAILGKDTEYGPYGGEAFCFQFVREQGMLGNWDCEWVVGYYPGWYVFKP